MTTTTHPLPAERVADRLAEGALGRIPIAGLGELEVCGEGADGRVLMAHGAGAGQDSGFMLQLRNSIAEQGVQVLAFEFEYMRRMRLEGRRRPPPGIDRLVDETALWCDIVSHPRLAAPWLGGKSMGGRAASLLAARDGAEGLILCGYPFHPPGKPDKTRLSHWPLLSCPVVVLQGTRDPFGTREEVQGYALPPRARVYFLEDGDHDWNPRKASGLTQASLIAEAAAVIARAVRTAS